MPNKETDGYREAEVALTKQDQIIGTHCHGNGISAKNIYMAGPRVVLNPIFCALTAFGKFEFRNIMLIKYV